MFASDTARIETISVLTEKLTAASAALRATLSGAHQPDMLDRAYYYREKVLPAMHALRQIADDLEIWVARDCWPFPTYTDLLFYE